MDLHLGVSFTNNFLVVNLPYKLIILGSDILKQKGIQLNFQTEIMSTAERDVKLRHEKFENIIKQHGEVSSDIILTAFELPDEQLGS